jgi:hydrogenase nickel incorporation protein HypA/HybF
LHSGFHDEEAQQMHETRLVGDLLRKIGEVAAHEGASHIRRIRVKLGPWAEMTPDHFREHFVHASRGTPAEGSELEITLAADPSDSLGQDVILESVDMEGE